MGWWLKHEHQKILIKFTTVNVIGVFLMSWQLTFASISGYKQATNTRLILAKVTPFKKISLGYMGGIIPSWFENTLICLHTLTQIECKCKALWCSSFIIFLHIRFFYLYHFLPYAYYIRFNGQFWFIPFLFHWLLLQVSGISIYCI